MIIGNGLIASEFKKKAKDYEDCVIFAAGVSNSGEVNKDEFDREKLLLIETLDKHEGMKFIYFSTILVGYVDNAYYRHKREMEILIEKTATTYLIFRVPQIVGMCGNKNNLINYLRDNIQDNKTIIIYEDVRRSFMDIEDVVRVVSYCKEKANRVIIKAPGIEKIRAIVLCNKIGRILGKNPKVTILASNENTGWEYEESDMYSNALVALGIDPKGYTQRILEKYLK